MVLDVIHPARPNVSREELSQKLGEMYKAPSEQVAVFGMRTHYGGGRSTGFALIYDSKESLKFEPSYRLVRKGLQPKVEKASRKLRKERKNRAKKVRFGSPFSLSSCSHPSSVPRYQEDQGCGAPQEGQVNCCPHSLSFSRRTGSIIFVASVLHTTPCKSCLATVSYAYACCLSLSSPMISTMRMHSLRKTLPDACPSPLRKRNEESRATLSRQVCITVCLAYITRGGTTMGVSTVMYSTTKTDRESSYT